MLHVLVMTDSNSGMSKEEAAKYGVVVLPMSFIINGKIYYEGVDITHEEFFEMLAQGAEPFTSQPAPGEVIDLWNEYLKKYDEIIYIPMSSGLSKSYETACMLAQDYEGKVQVLDSKRISVPQKQLVMDAVALVKQGMSAKEVREELEKEALRFTIYITVDTLKYLKRGGRITAAAAVFGTMLNVKPVLVVKGEKLDAYEKVRGMKAGRRAMIAAIRKEIEENFQEELKNGELCIHMAHSSLNAKEVAEWKEQIIEAFPELPLHTDMLTLSLSCHIGPGGLGIAVSKCRNHNW